MAHCGDQPVKEICVPSCCLLTNTHVLGPAGKPGGGGAVNSTKARRSRFGLIRTAEQFEDFNYRSRQEGASPHLWDD